MQKINNKFVITKHIFISITVTCTIICYFIYYSIFGSKGISQYFQLKTELQQKELIKERLENTIENKQNMVNGMSLESLDLDLLDEEARKNLGYANEKEIVIYKKEI